MTPGNPGIAGRAQRFWRFWLGDRGLSLFLLLLFLALFLAPFTESAGLALLTSVFFSLVMVAGVANIAGHPAARIGAGAIACAAIALRWICQMAPSPALLRWNSLVSLIFMLLLTVALLYQVFGDDGRVTVHRVRGAIAVYLLFGITWSILYGLLDQTLPHAFNFPSADGLYSARRQESITYFSFVTLATLGYGDLTPTHPVSRMFAVLEALLGALYPATLLARLVSLEISHRGG